MELTDVNDTILNAITAELSIPDVGSLQLKVVFTVSGNDTPVLEALDVIPQ